jgi:hypothetical protein
VETDWYVGRVNDEECLKILKEQGQYSFDSPDDPALRHSLRRIDINKIRHAKSAYILMRNIPSGCKILFVGTKWWKPKSGVGAKTILGYGITAAGSQGRGPYNFRRSSGWRHRLWIADMRWVDKHHRGVTLDELGIRKGFPPSRFFQDRRGLCQRVLTVVKVRVNGPATNGVPTTVSRARQRGPKDRLPRLDKVAPKLGVVLAAPQDGREAAVGGPSTARWPKDSKRIGRRAEEIVFKHLRAELAGPFRRSLDWPARRDECPGWDIEYRDAKNRRIAIEVKGTKARHASSFELTANEWEAAQKLGARFWFYLVAGCFTKAPVIQTIRNPNRKFQKGEMKLQPTSYRVAFEGS